MTDQQTPAEQIPGLLEQLHDRVETRDVVPRYRRVHRGRRDNLLLELAVHRTTGPGLLAQLGIVASAGTRPGTVIPGASVPGGSAGWDADGALSPMAVGGVRADASSAVWCGGVVPVPNPAGTDAAEWAPCANRWPRHAWVDLLDQATRERTAS